MSYFDKFDAQETKLANILDGAGLLHKFDTTTYPMTLTISQNESTAEQTNLFPAEEIDASSHDAKLVLTFPVGEIGVRVYGRLIISDALMGKIKNQGKKMRDLWLQGNYADMMSNAERTSDSIPSKVGYDAEELPHDFTEFMEPDDGDEDEAEE